MDATWVMDTLKQAIKQHGAPNYINSDQGSQFTSDEYIEYIKSLKKTEISMDGKGRATDNAHIERFFRTIKYDKLYLNRFYILISILTPDNLVRLNPLLLIHKTVTSKPKKQTNDRTKREFLLHKEKEENGKPSPQKQEFSCSSPSAVTSQPHTCFFTPTFELKITSIKSHFKPYFFRFTQFSE